MGWNPSDSDSELKVVSEIGLLLVLKGAPFPPTVIVDMVGK
jgi:hypothetical protein